MQVTAYVPAAPAFAASHLPFPIIKDCELRDADLILTDNPFIQTVHVWLSVFGERTLQQHPLCGHDMLNWLRNVERRCYETLLDYWYTIDPLERNKDVARWIMYRTDNMQ